MGRFYTAPLIATSFSNGFDAFELGSTSTQIIVVHSVFVGQSSDAGDAEAEMVRARIKRGSGSVTSGSGGSTPTAAPHNFSDTAFGGTLEAGNTTRLLVSTGAIAVLHEETFNVQAGWYHTPTPEERIVLSPSQYFVVTICPYLDTDPGGTTTFTDAMYFSGRITFEVLGSA